jgi:hypothetical protein
MKIEHLIVTGDSELVINQFTHKYKIKKERLKLYFKRVSELMESFCSFNIYFIQRDKKSESRFISISGFTIVDTERGVNQYQVQFKTFFNLYLNHSTISNEK